MFFVLSKTLDLAVSPLAWVVLLVAVAFVLVTRRSARRGLATGCLAAAIAVMLVLGNPAVANRLWWSLEQPAAWRPTPQGDYDVVVVLGGLVPRGYLASGEAASYGDNVERLLVPFDLLRSGRARHVIVTGGVAAPPEGARVEAEVLAEQLAAWGVERDRILVEPRAVNTRQNAIETARIVREKGFQRVLVVTSAFHVPRAEGCFRAVDLPVDVLPVDVRATPPGEQAWDLAPRSHALDRSSDVLRELTGRAVYRLLGYAR